MSMPASVAKHPIHPILVAFPIGLFVFSLTCDIIFSMVGLPIWASVALYSMGGGIIGGLLAAIPGFIDFLSIRESEMKAVAAKHMVTNVLGLIIFAANFFFRIKGAISWSVALSLSVAGIIVLGFGGWLGGEMVYVKGMAVEQLSKKLNRL